MEEPQMFKVGEFCDLLFLAFWNTNVAADEKPDWAVFQARRTGPGEAVSRRGKKISFREKILTTEEANEYAKAQEPVKETANAEFSQEDMELFKQFMAFKKMMGK